ncbi:sigma-54-dependent Fis family transcriptional regulator [Motiliproteus sp. SC1-56]|uniref:sigma-54 interaction domain-containing protein n=1 Tax=Motiliproteus sp. SC1-56 TaxID=2799565 RepID=UPI001A8ECED8|nr:sigma-54 dependent transcriptional regulator [Motiliproteus sp. SC1-56]
MTQHRPPLPGWIENAVGESPRWRRALALVRKMAPLDAPVLVTGKSGVGKEVIAQTLHRLSRRNEGPFIPLNCGLLQGNLLESELFGHTRGAFTGATCAKQGLCAAAVDGTLFLDEIGELPPSSQAMLLRLLETGEYRPLGSTELHRTNARVIAATHRHLPQMVAEGRFRQDLYYRLNVLSIHVPSLYRRPEDIPLLVEHFLSQGCAGAPRRLTAAAIERLRRHRWPGNVRELRNLVERVRVLSDSSEIDEFMVEEVLASPSAPASARLESGAGQLPGGMLGAQGVAPLADMEAAYVQWAVDQHRGNVSDAARSLGVARSTIYRILHRAGDGR